MMTRQTPGESLLRKRILLVTGKGGVGKTSFVAALARYSASIGRRTLVLDIERTLETPSHLLAYLGGGRSFPEDRPLILGDRLHAARLSASAGHQIFLEEQLPFRWMARTAVRSKYINRFLSMAPGFQELGILYRGMPYLREKLSNGQFRYEHVIVDLPATGHALALTSIPGPMLAVFENGPVANSIREAQSYFNDSSMTGAIVVSLPEPLVVSETVELMRGLARDDVMTAGLVLNQFPNAHWSEQERQALIAQFEQIDAPLLGRWSLQRVERAYESLHALQEVLKEQAQDTPLVTLHEQAAGLPQERVAEMVAMLGTTPSAEAA